MNPLTALTAKLKEYQQKLDSDTLLDVERAKFENLLQECKDAIFIYEWDNTNLD